MTPPTRPPSHLLVLILTLLVTPAFADEQKSATADQPKLEDTPKLTVRGEAELTKPADQMRMSIGVISEAADAGEAIADNSELMRDVVRALDRVGLEEGEYETGQFRVRPQYSRRPRQPGVDWKPQIIGYEIINTVSIKTTQIDLAGKIIEAAHKAGANTAEIDGFDLADPRKHRAEAIRTATRHALDDARVLADAAELALVRIVSINLDHTPIRPNTPRIDTMSRAMAEADAAPPITPGDVTVKASVRIVYEIAPRAHDH